MKKLLLVVAASIIAVSASAQVRPSLKVNQTPIESKLKVAPLVQVQAPAQGIVAKQLGKQMPQIQAQTKVPRKVVTPQGTPKWYTMDGAFATYFGVYLMSGLADQVSIDGNDVYFKTLFPYDYPELWTKGTLNEAGNEISIPMDEYIGTYDDSYGLAPCELVIAEDGNTIEGVKPLVLAKDGDHIYVDDPDTTRYIALGAFQDGSFAGYLTYALLQSLNPVEQELNQVVVPESATKSEYAYSYNDYYGRGQATLGTIAVDGNDIYFDQLALGTGWVKGTIDGNSVKIPSDQFLGGDTGYFLFFDGLSNFGMDEDYNTTFEIDDTFDLTFEDGVYIQTVEEANAGLLTIDNALYNYTYGYSIKPFTGVKPGVPSDPSDLFIYDYTDYYGQYCFGGTTPNVDINGDYMAPENMEISLWEDGDMLTLTADDGYYLSEDVTWMPYGWTDDNGGYDLGFVSLSPYFYLYESLFTELGMQVRYTVDGVTNYSNIVYVDLDGNTRTETGISGVYETTSKSDNKVYNLAGQRVSNDFKGIAIKNGKKMLMK